MFMLPKERIMFPYINECLNIPCDMVPESGVYYAE